MSLRLFLFNPNSVFQPLGPWKNVRLPTFAGRH